MVGSGQSAIPKKPQRFKLLDDFSFEIVEKEFNIDENNKIPNQPHSTISILQKLQHVNLYDTLTHKDKTKKGLLEYALCCGQTTRDLPNNNKANITQQANTPSVFSAEEFEELEDLEDFQERNIENPKLTIKTPQARKRKVSVKDLVFALERALEVDNRRKLKKNQHHPTERWKDAASNPYCAET